MVIRLLPALFATLATIGCSSGEADRDATVRIDTVAENRIEVVNTGAASWTAETAWKLEEDLRLGTVEAGEGDPEQFGDISSVTTDSRGRIYVLDTMAQEIRVFRADGTFVHTIGGEGSGPGEFSFARFMTMGPGDTLVVLDDGEMRYSVFAPDGTLVETIRRDIVGTYSRIFGTTLSDGSYVDWIPDSPDGRSAPRSHFYPVRYTPDFGRVDTLPRLEHLWDMLPSGGIQAYFSPALVGSVDRAGGIWFADSHEYRIYRRDLDGDTTLAFSLPVEAVSVGEVERDHVREQLSRRPDQLSETLEALPETRSIIHRLVPDNAGHVFILADVDGEPSGTVVDVFQESGEYRGRMTLPTPVPLEWRFPPVVHATAEHIFAVVTDEFDVPYVARFRIVKGD